MLGISRGLLPSCKRWNETMTLSVINRAMLGLAAAIFPIAIAAQTALQLDGDQAVDTAQEQTTGPAGAVSTEAEQAAAAAQAQQGPTRTVTRRQPAVRGFVLRDIRFTGTSSYVSQAQLDAAEASLRGARLGSARAVAQVGAVLTNTLYGQQGLTTAQAVIRDVNIRSGVVTVELLEARIGQVRYRSNILSDAYLDYRLRLPQGALADNRDIDAQLERFRLTDGISLGASYTPGAEFGETNVTVGAPDIPRHSTVISLDNYGAPSSGKEQITLSHVIQSVTGWNDPVSLSYSQKEGSKALNFGYARTVSRSGARLSLALGGSETKTLGAFPVVGSSRDASVTLSLPVVLESARRTNATIGLARFRETSEFLGVRILDQAGREVSLGVSDTRSGDGYSLSTSASLTFGQYDNAVIAQTGVDYSYVSGSMSYARNLGADLFMSLQVGAQGKLNGAIPSTRQFTVTSASAVRGYPVNQSAGSEGYYARLQMEKSTPYALGGDRFGVRPFAFFDVGEARDATGAGLGLAQSAGIGTSFTSGKMVFGDLFIAKPLTTNIVGWTAPNDDPMIGGSIAIRF